MISKSLATTTKEVDVDHFSKIMSLNSLIPLEWFEIRSSSRSPELRVGHSSTFVRSSKEIFLLGGANPSQCFADFYSLSLPAFVWTKLIGEDLSLQRYEHSAVYSSIDDEGKILFFGGANPEKNFNDVRALNLSSKTIEDWTPNDKTLVSPRTHHSSCSIDTAMFIFSGGFQGAKAIDDAELYRFDFKSRQWSCVPVHGTPPEQRHGHCLVSFANRFLYLHGGMDGRTFFSSIHSVDLNENPPRWKEFSSSSSGPLARAAHGAVAIEKSASIVIFGGLARNGQALNDTWSWSIENQQWTELLCRSIPRARLDFAHCLVEISLDDDNSSKTIPFLFIHGGTDTEGEVFDDCFLLRLTFDDENE